MTEGAKLVFLGFLQKTNRAEELTAMLAEYRTMVQVVKGPAHLLRWPLHLIHQRAWILPAQPHVLSLYPPPGAVDHGGDRCSKSNGPKKYSRHCARHRWDLIQHPVSSAGHLSSTNGDKLARVEFQLEIRSWFLTMRAGSFHNSLPVGVVGTNNNLMMELDKFMVQRGGL